MKIFKFILLFIIINVFSLTSCKEFDKGEYQFQFYVASDLHYLSNSLVPDTNEIYLKNVLTSDGRVQELDVEIFDTFIEEIKTNQPKYAFLTGDLTFNGELQSHIDIIKKLNQIENTKVLVIPGNHDCFNIYARDFSNDQINQTTSVTKEEFKLLYEDYGYSDAISYDLESLSYFYPLSENMWALMLDTTLTQYNEEVDSNVISGQLFESTYNWIEENLQIAQQKNIQVISFTHHNLITHHPRFENNFTLYESYKLLDIFKKYQVKLNFSGHLHIQNIIEEDGVYDIASGSLLDYGNRFGIVDVYDNAYDYQTKKINLEQIDLNDYAFDVFYQKYYDKQYSFYQLFYKDYDYEKLLDLSSQINAYFFDGNYQKVNQIYKENRSLLKVILEKDSKSYIASIMKLENKNHFEELIKK